MISPTSQTREVRPRGNEGEKESASYQRSHHSGSSFCLGGLRVWTSLDTRRDAVGRRDSSHVGSRRKQPELGGWQGSAQLAQMVPVGTWQAQVNPTRALEMKALSEPVQEIYV